jgi:pimeloyl-ACP methyl ester carboxylesterase
MYGDRSALVTPDTLLRSLASLPRGTPSIAIPDAAHHVLIDQPLALTSALRALLACWPPNREPVD